MVVKSIGILNAWEKSARLCIQGLVLFVPLFFIPWGSVSLGFSKHILITIVVFIACVLWIIGQAVRGSISFKKDVVWYLFSGTILFSGFTSWSFGVPAISFFGNGGEVDVFFVILAFGLLSFSVVSLFRSLDELNRLVFLLFISAFVTIVYGVLQVLGWWVFPWEFTRSISYNTIGTTNALALYVGAVLVALMSYCVTCRWRWNWRSCVVIFAHLLLFCILFLFGYWDVFILITAISGVLLVLSRRSLHFSRVGVFVVGGVFGFSLLISVFSLMSINPSIVSLSLPSQVRPTLSSSFSVVSNTYSETVWHALFGSGSGTFNLQYALYKDVNLNKTSFWGVHFTQGANAVLTTLVHWGILGTLLFLALIGWLVVRGWRVMMAEEYSSFSIGLCFIMMYFVGSLFLYHQNIVIYFLMFLVGGMIMSLSLVRQRSFSLSLKQWYWYGIIAIIALFLVWVSFVYGMSYIAALSFERGVRASDRNNVDESILFINRAVAYNPRNETYYRTLSTAYLLKARSLVTLDKDEDAQKELALFADALASSVSAAQRAIALNERNSANYIALAKVYENAIPFVDKSLDEAIRYYVLARDRDPNNPVIYSNMGRSYVAWAEALARRKSDPSEVIATYEKAIEYYKKALQLKVDHFPAHFQLIQLLDGLDRDQEAVADMLLMKKLSPRDPQIFLEIGLLNYRAGRLSEAREDLEEAITLSPSYANARYFLGLVYDRQGNRNEALKQFNTILTTNPDNEEVRRIIDNIRTGKPALQGIVQ